MLAQSSAVAPIVVEGLLEPRHRHDAGCFWEVAECRWRCSGRPSSGRADCSEGELAQPFRRFADS